MLMSSALGVAEGAATAELLVERVLDKNDQRLLRLMTKRVGVALREQKNKGVVRADQGPGQYMLWEISR